TPVYSWLVTGSEWFAKLFQEHVRVPPLHVVVDPPRVGIARAARGQREDSPDFTERLVTMTGSAGELAECQPRRLRGRIHRTGSLIRHPRFLAMSKRVFDAAQE